MGGQLSLTSCEGKGTTLTFTIPLKIVQEDKIPVPGNENGTEPPRLSATNGIQKDDGRTLLTILLAEDIETNRLVIKHYLAPFNVRIDCVGDGLSAVEQYKAERYNLILMDVELPEMGGFEAVNAIRSFEEKNGIIPVPIVVLSAHALSGYHNKELPQGIQAFLSKPFKRERLLSTLSQWVHIPRADAPLNSDHKTRPVFHAEPDLALVIPVLFKEIGREIETLRQAIIMGDAETLKRLSHGLKGASANCGVKPLTEYFMQINNLVSDGRINETGDILEAIENYLNTVNVVYGG
jgi:CheY-like chemotaxis protein